MLWDKDTLKFLETQVFKGKIILYVLTLSLLNK